MRSIVDQVFFIWYYHTIQVIIVGAWLPHAVSSERRCKDVQKRTLRYIDTQHEEMELHRRCPGYVDAEMSFRVVLS